MMKKIEIFWGADREFELAIETLENVYFLSDIISHINKTDIQIRGISNSNETPLKVENLIIHTDDYGGIKEWAILGFSNNILLHLKVDIENIWICNPPDRIYRDIKKTFDDISIIKEHKSEYKEVSLEDMKNIADGYNDIIIGQPHVIKQILPPIYSLKNLNRNRPVTLLFLGDSGIGKTETAKYISKCLDADMVRIQFSMQQTMDAYQYIFGADHGEDSLARELIRRNSNVILLDEFDKVSPSFYNAFYQMFDEGIFVDANYSVDVSRCIIICTTNYRTQEEAERNLGTPIYSRFSKTVTFKPISVDNKLKIARICYSNLLNSVDEEDKKLIKNNEILAFFEDAIKKGAYLNMRMLRNDIEDAINFEILQARGILN